MKIKLTLIVICLLALSLNKSYAQVGPPPSADPEPSAASLKIAGEMLDASGVDVQFNRNINAILNQFGSQMPAEKQDKFKEIMRAFFAKYFSWEILKPTLCKMYAQQFTEAEMKQLTVFYKTPLGTKLNSVQPVLFEKGMALGQQTVALHQAELQQMMADSFK